MPTGARIFCGGRRGAAVSAFALTPDGQRRSAGPELDLWTVADAAGLSPKGRGRNFAFDCPDCGRKGKASGRRDGPWHCFACDAKGNALTLARRFELAGAELPRPTVQAPETTNRNGVAPSTARAAWAALEGQRDAYRERLALYLAEVRGWPAELAEAGARVLGWAWIPADCPELPRPLAWTARDADRRAAFALRDERGEVWTLERRWTSPAPPADPETTPKALRLRTRSEEAGRLAIFGRVPDAVAAADRGEPIYLCEGGPDYLAAAALCRLDGRGAALGAHGHAGLPKVAAALRDALEAAAVPVAGVHVLCVPHLGDKGDVGERSMIEAADALAGAGAVSIVRVPVDAAGKGDLADAARGGAGELRTLAELAVSRYAAPIDVRAPDAHEAIRAALLRALQAGDGPNVLALVIMPPGVGKTTAAFERAAYAARQGRRVVFALPDHVNAEKKLDEFRALYPDVPAEHAKGMPSLCELPARHPDKRDAIERAAATMGRRMCEGCPLARQLDGSGGTCDGWRTPKVRPGVVTFAAHAGLAPLARSMKPSPDPDSERPRDLADLVIVDELPALVDKREIGPAHLQSLRVGSLAARRWYKANPGHGAFAAELAAVAGAIDADTPRGVYALRVEGARAVVDALRQRPAAIEAAAEVLAEVAADLTPDRAPTPKPADARRGAADRWPDADAWALVRALARAVCDPENTPELGCLRLDGDGGGWAFEVSRLFEFAPGGARVLALDATGEIDRLQWESLAARYGRTLAPVIVTAIGEKPASAEHYQTDRLRTGRLWARVGRRVAFLADAPGAIRNALLRAAGPAPCALGVLTHKPAADALRWGRDLAADPDAAPPDGAAFELDDCHARAVAELAAGLVSRGWGLEIGHFGRDDRGSNAFERVNALAILGPPRPDWGAVAEDARVMSTPGNVIDAEKLAEARTKASLVQGIARGRHLRRGPENRVRLFFAGDCEAPTGAELPGVVWTVEAADRSHAPAFETLDAAAAVAELADRAGCLDVAAVKVALRPHGIGWRLAERLCGEEAARRGWVARRDGQAGRKVYGAVHGEKRSDFGSVHHSWEDVPAVGQTPAPGGAPLVRSDERLTAPESLGNRPCMTSSAPWKMPEDWPPPPSEYDGPPLDVDCDPPPWELAG
jgi:hypothetical protein